MAAAEQADYYLCQLNKAYQSSPPPPPPPLPPPPPPLPDDPGEDGFSDDGDCSVGFADSDGIGLLSGCDDGAACWSDGKSD